MFEFNRFDALVFSVLAYFDILDFKNPLPLGQFADELLHSEKYMDQQRTDLYTLKCLEFSKQFNYERYADFMITDYLNDNNHTGLVITKIENADHIYLLFRGSEFLDDEYGRCAWEDWRDNLEIFITVTAQQLKALNYLNQMQTNGKKIVLLGHSKGGNLAMVLSLVCSDEILASIDKVYAFNAPGINNDMLKTYAFRAEDEAYLNKLEIYENEHDAVSSFFNHLKKATILASVQDNLNLRKMFHNHQLYSISIKENELIEANDKSMVPKLCDYFINQVFVKLPKESVDGIIKEMMEYFNSHYSVDELYHIFLYHIGKYTRMFDELNYEQIKEVEFETLIDNLKQDLFGKASEFKERIVVDQLDPIKQNVHMVVTSLKDYLNKE